ncbi:MAG: nitrogen fixation protein NifH [Candidatus Marinimicrobia bacterium]|nr:nitrogen fixation protein NifH [Candidatus Neomarinimicrobiota bacterium]
MSDWKSFLKAYPIDWLLEENNPPVRYFTLTDILERTETDPEVKRVKMKIMETELVPIILAKQKVKGYWETPENFYIKSKYKGTVWQFLILAQLGASGKDKRIVRTCEFIFQNSQDRKNGGFSYLGDEVEGGKDSKVLPCLTGNIIWCLIRFGYIKDHRVQKGIDWITTYQRFDDGTKDTPKGWPYDKFERCWGKHTCHMGIVKAIKALAEIPANKRSEDVKNAIKKGIEYLLKHHIYKRSHNLNLVSKPEWLQFGFPLMWNTDILEILYILTKLNYRDNRMQEAVDLVISKQDDQGKWKLERTFNGRFQVNIEKKGRPSKWVTLNALKVLKSYYGKK